MIFTETDLPGAFLVELEKRADERGFFARSWCQKEFSDRGLNARLVQCNISFNKRKGTLRGLHYQAAPHEEAKLVRCTRGSLYDVIVDLRPKSPTFKRHFGLSLTPDSGRMLFIPEGFAHGFQTLEDNTEIFYQMSEFFAPNCARGVRWNDPAFGIKWPITAPIVNERDNSYPDFV
jgi:dTDP-4-dehydrorhamnose 3,5-epimerase